MVNYLAKFCNSLSELASPLRSILKSGVEWQRDANTDQVFDKVKNSIANLPVLRLFDQSLPVLLSVDANMGVGAVLLQNGQPLEFELRTLTDTQQRYVQIEKEVLTVLFGLQRFHQYVYGQTVTVKTDHKPLLGTVNKAIALCSPRIQRMRLLLQTYAFQIVYKPGKELHIADALSRAPEVQQFVDDSSQFSDENVNMLVFSTVLVPTSHEKFIAATLQDPTLQAVLT
jgi:hypothetical protein